MLPKASSAVTVTVPGVPAAPLAAMLTTRCVAAPPFTVSVFEVPVIAPCAVSVAVMVWLPALSKVSLKVAMPLVNVMSAGSTAAASVDVKWTVPE